MHAHTHTYTHTITLQLYFFFHWERDFKIYSFSNFQVYSTVLLTVITMLHMTSPELMYLLIVSFYLLITFSHFPHLWKPPIGSLYAWIIIIFLDSMHKWDHLVFIFLCLTYFTYHSVLKVYPCCYKWQDLFLFMDE